MWCGWPVFFTALKDWRWSLESLDYLGVYLLIKFISSDLHVYIHTCSKKEFYSSFYFFCKSPKILFCCMVLHSRLTHDLGLVNETLGCTHASDISTCSTPKSSSASRLYLVHYYTWWHSKGWSNILMKTNRNKIWTSITWVNRKLIPLQPLRAGL